jgi:H+-translocating diphosphatase
VGRTAQEVVREVRRQFRERPGILNGSDKPECAPPHPPLHSPSYDACVSIVTRAALSQMTKPAALALGLPVAYVPDPPPKSLTDLCRVGFLFKFIGRATGRVNLAPEVLASFMIFGSLTGLLMAIFLDNAGGAWDNAKKFIESGAMGGKGSEAHKAAVTGDTVGDPFKVRGGGGLSR